MRTRHGVRITNDETRAAALPSVCCVLLLLLLVLGCESGVEQYKPEPNVHCLVRTNEDAVTLMAGMTVGYYDSVSVGNQWQGTSGVLVGIGHRGAVTALAAVADSPGYYRTDSLPVVPGDSYLLSVTYPGGLKVSGNTVVPDTVRFVGFEVDTVFEVPWPGDTYTRIKVSYSWSESQGASGYYQQMNIWYRSGEDSSLQRYGPMFTSTRRDSWTLDPFYYRWDSLSGEVVDSLPLDRVTIEVKAIDRNYYDYVLLGYTSGGDPDKMHLDGGVGVFGSACVVDSTLRFQSCTMPRSGLPIASISPTRPPRRSPISDLRFLTQKARSLPHLQTASQSTTSHGRSDSVPRLGESQRYPESSAW